MKKGFTLLELLSVIVILAVVTLIAVPVVSGIITKVRLNALKSSANGLLEASDLYYSQYANTKSVRFDIDDNNISSNDTTSLLSYKGELKEGTVIINKKGEVTLCITDGTNSVYKNYKDQKVTEVANKKCNIPSSTYVVYLDNSATLNEYSNEELTDIVTELQSKVTNLESQLNSKANQEDLELVSSAKATKNDIYPVGSIYVSTNSTSPETLFGGTWERIQDRFLLAAGSTYAAGNTGGSATNSHTHSVTASGTVNGHYLTISEMPSHTHREYLGTNRAVAGGGNYILASEYVYGEYTSTSTTTAYQQITGYEGGSGSHNHTFTGSAVTSGGASDTNNMPPYLSVYVWKRTA